MWLGSAMLLFKHNTNTIALQFTLSFRTPTYFQLTFNYDDEITLGKGSVGNRMLHLGSCWTRYILCGLGYDQGFANLRPTW